MNIVIAVKRSQDMNQNNESLQRGMKEALKLKDSQTSTLTCISIGTEDDQQNQINTAIKLGANKGIQLTTKDSLDAYTISKNLVDVIQSEAPELVIICSQLTDRECQTGKLLSTMLKDASPTPKAFHARNQYRLLVIREIDSGAHTVLVPVKQSVNYSKVTSGIVRTLNSHSAFHLATA